MERGVTGKHLSGGEMEQTNVILRGGPADGRGHVFTTGNPFFRLVQFFDVLDGPPTLTDRHVTHLYGRDGRYLGYEHDLQP